MEREALIMQARTALKYVLASTRTAALEARSMRQQLLPGDRIDLELIAAGQANRS
jgi:hypothetical protein